MSAVCVAQVLRLIVVLAKEKCGIGVVGGVVVKQLVNSSQQPLWIIPGDRALAAQIRLQVRHQQSAGNPFSRDVSKHQSEPLPPEIEEVVIIAADLASLYADAGIVQRLQHGKVLWKEPRLHLF